MALTARTDEINAAKVGHGDTGTRRQGGGSGVQELAAVASYAEASVTQSDGAN